MNSKKTILGGIALMLALAAAPTPVTAYAVEGGCEDFGGSNEPVQGSACAQQGNCNAYDQSYANAWIASDCSGSHTQNAYYCTSGAGSGGASGQVAAGYDTENGDTTAGASAGAGCDNDQGGTGNGGVDFVSAT